MNLWNGGVFFHIVTQAAFTEIHISMCTYVCCNWVAYVWLRISLRSTIFLLWSWMWGAQKRISGVQDNIQRAQIVWNAKMPRTLIQKAMIGSGWSVILSPWDQGDENHVIWWEQVERNWKKLKVQCLIIDCDWKILSTCRIWNPCLFCVMDFSLSHVECVYGVFCV